MPLVSAAMDTVTEAEMAIAMARAGGIGVLHKNMSIDRQAMQVDIVKRSESGMIINPYTLPETASLREASEPDVAVPGVAACRSWTCDGRLVGIITNRDLQFERSLDRPVAEAMTKDRLVTAPVGTDAGRGGADPRQAPRGEAARGGRRPPPEGADHGEGHPQAPAVSRRRTRTSTAGCAWPRRSARRATTSRAPSALIDAGVDALIIDTAHGHAEGVLEATVGVREAFPDTQLVVGNVATREGARALVERGVDAVKVGVGPGSICTTRVVTGVGVPQLTAVFDAVEGAGDVPVIADGGIKYSGDAVKALAAGACSVMMGIDAGGHRGEPGRGVPARGPPVQDGARHGIAVARCRTAARTATSRRASCRRRSWCPRASRGGCRTEGRWATCCSRWSADCAAAWATWAAGRSRSCARDTEFVRITAAGLRESHPHDVTITREAPNYSI